MLPRSKWWTHDKPLILDTQSRKIRSGRYATANDLAVVSKQSAWKRTRGYREMKEMFIPSEKNSHTKEAIVSLQEIVEALWQACLGSPQEVTCPDCGGKNIVAFKKDPNALFKFYENLVGRATETSEVSVTNKSLIAILNDTTKLDELITIELDPRVAAERAKLIEGTVVGGRGDLED